MSDGLETVELLLRESVFGLYSGIQPGITTAEGRIAQWCEWFEAPPKLEYGDEPDEDEIELTDESFQWMNESGASFDWIFLGDANGMAHAFKKRWDAARPFIDILSKLYERDMAAYRASREVLRVLPSAS